MTGFDVFVILAILLSAAAGWFRGALRELTSLFSFFLAGLVALITLPWTAPFGRSLVDPDWAGSILAVGIVFVVLYFTIRITAGSLSKGVRGHALGAIDQTAGAGLGLLRAMAFIGSIHLILMSVVGEDPPRWFAEAKSLPVSIASASTIQTVLPMMAKGADALTPIVKRSVHEGFSDQTEQ
ncbi:MULTISPECIES: CvpA family protein [unclassified Brevundimonas]|uniref:CvpA family protein n=1 Tax=unclassified Brevundimonas TaxID=2622653 RepID=UPI0025BAAB82|nr:MULTISPECIES: CvpA family protein [unclassified Brevundimonas]